MNDAAEPKSPSASQLHAALLDYFSAPGKYQLTLRQPALLFSSVREILQIASGRGAEAAGARAADLQQAAAFFIRAALLYPGADHYATLGLPAKTEPVELKERYRLLMRLIHPDYAEAGSAAWPADAAVRVNRAYEVLSSPVLRGEYDEQLGSLGAQRAAEAALATQRRAPVAQRQEQPPAGLRISKKAAWGVVAVLALIVGAMLMPGPEPVHLVQKAPARASAAGQDTVRGAAVPPVEVAAALIESPKLAAVPPATPPPPPVQAAPVAAAAPAAPAAAVTAAPAAAAATPAPPVTKAPVAPPSPAPKPAPARLAMPAPAPAPVARMEAPPAWTQTPSGAAVPAALPSWVQAAPAVVPPRPAAVERIPADAVASPAPVQAAAIILPAQAAPAASAAPHVTAVAATSRPQGPTLAEAQPVLTQLLQMLESGSGEQLLRLLDADARQAPSAQALSRHYEQLVRGGRPVRLSSVEFKGEPRDGALLVTGRIRLHAGEPTIGSHGERILVRAEFASRGGKVILTGLSGGVD